MIEREGLNLGSESVLPGAGLAVEKMPGIGCSPGSANGCCVLEDWN